MWNIFRVNNETHIFSMASDISGQNSSTIVSSFFKAKTLSSGRGSSNREITPATKFQNYNIYRYKLLEFIISSQDSQSSKTFKKLKWLAIFFSFEHSSRKYTKYSPADVIFIFKIYSSIFNLPSSNFINILPDSQIRRRQIKYCWWDLSRGLFG